MTHYDVIQGIGSYDATYSYIEVRPPLPAEYKETFKRALDWYIVIDEVPSQSDSTVYEVHHEEAHFWPAESAHVLNIMIETLNEADEKVLVYPIVAVDGDASLFEMLPMKENA